jgi:uncharacterized protein (DUF1501 family)
MVARIIAARQQLGLSRQIFFVALGGWDTHGDQLARHPALLATLSAAMDFFQKATAELAVEDQVTTFTASDFGRTLTSNGDGSDHGWAGNHLVMGGSVNGQRLYGSLPTIEIDGPQDSGRGRLIPTLAVDQMAATLGSWFGLAQSDLDEAFPNLANFTTQNLGFV